MITKMDTEPEVMTLFMHKKRIQVATRNMNDDAPIFIYETNSQNSLLKN